MLFDSALDDWTKKFAWTRQNIKSFSSYFKCIWWNGCEFFVPLFQIVWNTSKWILFMICCHLWQPIVNEQMAEMRVNVNYLSIVIICEKVSIWFGSVAYLVCQECGVISIVVDISQTAITTKTFRHSFRLNKKKRWKKCAFYSSFILSVTSSAHLTFAHIP